RRNLQRKRTRAATRKLHKLSGKQARFQRNTNHIISKRLVQKAKDTERGIALENLTGIRPRTTVSHPQRSKHANWAFYQLRSFIQYKAAVAGVAIALVDPRNTSRQCSECGYIDKANRQSQSLFLCGQCQYSALADYNAALNLRLRARAAVILPNGGSTPTGGMPTKVASSVAVQLQAAPL